MSSLESVISRKFAASIGASQRDSGVRVDFFLLTVKEMCFMGFDITIWAAVVVDCANSFCVRAEIG